MNDRTKYFDLFTDLQDVAYDRFEDFKRQYFFARRNYSINTPIEEAIKSEIQKIWSECSQANKKAALSFNSFCKDNFIDVLAVYLVGKCYKSKNINLKNVLI